MSLHIIDYLEGYNLQCARRNARPIPFLQQLLAKCIKEGRTPHAFNLQGNHEELRDQRLTDDYLDIIIIPFNGNNFLTKLDLSYNRITDSGGVILANWLRSTQSLQELFLVNNDLGAEAGIVLAEALTVNTTLKTLDLSHNKLDTDGGMAIAGMLQVNTTLMKLHVSRCDLSLSALIALCTALHHNHSLCALDISDNTGAIQYGSPTLHMDFVRHLAHMCVANKSIVELFLDKLNIDDYDMEEHLGSAFAAATNIKVLHLSSNHMMEKGARILASTLISHPSLETVRLSHNLLTSPGTMALVRMLKDNTQLTALYLDHVGAGEDTLLDLVHVLTGQNSTLSVLSVWGNNFYNTTTTGMSAANSGMTGINGRGRGSACEVWNEMLTERGRFQGDAVDVCFYEVEGEWHVAKNESFRG